MPYGIIRSAVFLASASIVLPFTALRPSLRAPHAPRGAPARRAHQQECYATIPQGARNDVFFSTALRPSLRAPHAPRGAPGLNPQTRHLGFRIARPGGGARRQDPIDLLHLLIAERAVDRPGILLQVTDIARPRNRDDVGLAEQPGQGELRRGATLPVRHRDDGVGELEIRGEVLAVETRLTTAGVALSQLVRASEAPHQKAAP